MEFRFDIFVCLHHLYIIKFSELLLNLPYIRKNIWLPHFVSRIFLWSKFLVNFILCRSVLDRAVWFTNCSQTMLIPVIWLLLFFTTRKGVLFFYCFFAKEHFMTSRLSSFFLTLNCVFWHEALKFIECLICLQQTHTHTLTLTHTHTHTHQSHPPYKHTTPINHLTYFRTNLTLRSNLTLRTNLTHHTNTYPLSAYLIWGNRLLAFSCARTKFEVIVNSSVFIIQIFTLKFCSRAIFDFTS